MKKKEIDYFKDKEVITVLDHCKKCGEYASINRDGLCVRCL